MTATLERPTTATSKSVTVRPATRVRAVASADRFDASRLLCVYLALLIFIPSNQVLPGLGAAGAPALVFAVFLMVRWAVARVQGTTPGGRNFLRAALIFFALAMIISYFVAHTRPLTALEANSADRGLIRLTGWAGVLLTALDGVPNRQAFHRVVRFAAIGGVVLAIIGFLQSKTSINPVDYIHIPGLQLNDTDVATAPELRNGHPRVYGTTSHPIEYATVLVMLIALVGPLALRFRPDRQSRLWFVAMLAMVFAFPLAVARSGFLAAIGVAIVVIPGLARRQRLRLLVVAPIGIFAFHSAFPSLLGTIRDLFFYTADGQEVARTGDYPVVWQYFLTRPIFGRGFGTFLPIIYRTLDNQFLGTVVEAGVVGLSAFVMLHVAAIVTAFRARRRAVSTDDRLLGLFLVGIPVAALLASATFDALSFPIFAGVLFLCFGLCGAYARLMTEASGLPMPTRVPVARNLRVRVAASFICVALGAVAVEYVVSLPTVWESNSTVILAPVNYPAAIRFQGTNDTNDLADILQQSVVSSDTRDQIRATGATADYNVALGSGSLEYGTDVLGDGSLMHIQTSSTDSTQALRTDPAVVSAIEDRLAQLQDSANVDASVRVVVVNTNVSAVYALKAGGSRAYLAIAGLVLAFSWLSWTVTERWLARRRRNRVPARPERVDSVNRAP